MIARISHLVVELLVFRFIYVFFFGLCKELRNSSCSGKLEYNSSDFCLNSEIFILFDYRIISSHLHNKFKLCILIFLFIKCHWKKAYKIQLKEGGKVQIIYQN